MKKEEFEIRSGSGLDEVESTRSALIAEDEKSGEIRVGLYQNIDRIKPLTPEAGKALKYFSQVFPAEDVIDGISLQKGELIVSNNGFGIGEISGIMHRRKGHISNQNCWVQRGFLFPQDIVDKSILKLSACE